VRIAWLEQQTGVDPAVIRRILTHLGLSLEPGEAAPSRAPPSWDDDSMPER